MPFTSMSSHLTLQGSFNKLYIIPSNRTLQNCLMRKKSSLTPMRFLNTMLSTFFPRMLSLPELDIKYLKTGLDTDLRPHKQNYMKMRRGEKTTSLLVARTTICLCSKYILDGSNNLLNKVANNILIF